MEHGIFMSRPEEWLPLFNDRGAHTEEFRKKFLCASRMCNVHCARDLKEGTHRQPKRSLTPAKGPGKGFLMTSNDLIMPPEDPHHASEGLIMPTKGLRTLINDAFLLQRSSITTLKDPPKKTSQDVLIQSSDHLKSSLIPPQKGLKFHKG